MDIGGGGDETVDRPAFPVHTDMDLHAEVVLVSLLRGGRGVNYGGIHDGSFGESQSFLLEVGVDFLKDSLAEAVGLEKMAELADGGLVGDGLVSGVDPPDEVSHGFYVVKGHLFPRMERDKEVEHLPLSV